MMMGYFGRGMAKLFVVMLTLSISNAIRVGENNGLARVPPMGWNTWNHFHCANNCPPSDETNCVSEILLKQTADALEKSGLRDKGYTYVDLDDCWMSDTRDKDGNLQPNPDQFPSGLKALSDYLHSKQFKFGIYGSCGPKTCQGLPGGEGYESKDVSQYVKWGVDLLKLDGCYANVPDMHHLYTLWSKLLRTSGRPIVYSCSWPAYAKSAGIKIDMNYVGSICNFWRNFDDIEDKWTSVTATIDYQVDKQMGNFSGPGKWNDPDMLEVGNGGMTFEEYKSHFSLWSLLAAPLVIGSDVRNMTSETLTILGNEEVIAVDQDPLGKQGTRIWKQGDREIWSRELSGGKKAVILFNRGDTQPVTVTLHFEMVGLDPSRSVKVRDMWLKKDLGKFYGSFHGKPVPHGVVMLLLEQSS